jgi:hypothetical protein
MEPLPEGHQGTLVSMISGPQTRKGFIAAWATVHQYGEIWGMNTGWWCNNHLEKYEFVNGKDDIPYMKWKINMFETTNQNMSKGIEVRYYRALESSNYGFIEFWDNRKSKSRVKPIGRHIQCTFKDVQI